jgi:hypothetical protein
MLMIFWLSLFCQALYFFRLEVFDQSIIQLRIRDEQVDIEELGEISESIPVVLDGAFSAPLCLFETDKRLVQRNKCAPRVFGLPSSWHKINPLYLCITSEERG